MRACFTRAISGQATVLYFRYGSRSEKKPSTVILSCEKSRYVSGRKDAPRPPSFALNPNPRQMHAFFRHKRAPQSTIASAYQHHLSPENGITLSNIRLPGNS